MPRLATFLTCRWNLSLTLLVAGIIWTGAIMVSEARGFGGPPAPCMVDPDDEPNEGCYCNPDTGGMGSMCWNGLSQELQCASNTIHGTWMPIWDPDLKEWTEQSCADPN